MLIYQYRAYGQWNVPDDNQFGNNDWTWSANHFTDFVTFGKYSIVFFKKIIISIYICKTIYRALAKISAGKKLVYTAN